MGTPSKILMLLSLKTSNPPISNVTWTHNHKIAILITFCYAMGSCQNLQIIANGCILQKILPLSHKQAAEDNHRDLKQRKQLSMESPVKQQATAS